MKSKKLKPLIAYAVKQKRKSELPESNSELVEFIYQKRSSAVALKGFQDQPLNYEVIRVRITPYAKQ